MDFAEWQSLYQQGPDVAKRAFTARLRTQPSPLREAVWATVVSEETSWADAATGPLQGVPFAVKDLFPLKGQPTRAGAKRFAVNAARDSRLISALKSNGAIPVGKTHLHEFAYGLTGENPHYGNVTHPQFPDHDAGGSSSGSAAAVAAGIVPFALGTDTGGSLRVPAAYCGLYSWRDVPRHAWITDAFPLAPSFDSAGWLAGTAADIRRVNTALRGEFPGMTKQPRGAALSPSVLGLQMDPKHEDVLSQTMRRLTSKNLSPSHDLLLSFAGCGQAYGILQSTEAYAVHQSNLDSRRADYGSAVWQRIDRGRHWTAAQLDEARLTAMRVRLAFDRFFEHHHFLVMPVSPQTAPTTTELSQTLRDTLLALTTPVSLAGLPTLTVPVPLKNGLSLGLQVIFPAPHEAALGWVLERCENC